MFGFSRNQSLPIGLDIGASSIRLMQLEVAGDGLRVVAAAREPMPPEAASADITTRCALAAEVAHEMLSAGGFSGRRVVASLPRELVHMKNLRLPSMPPSELDGAMQFEAGNLFPFDVAQSTVRWLTAGEVRQGTEARQELLVLAVRNDDIEVYVEQLHRAGMVLDSLDFEPCALYRTVERFLRRREDEQEVHVLADIGFRRTTVVIGRGHDVNFIKSIDIGGQHLRDAVARKLDIASEEAGALRRRLAEEAASDANDPANPDGVRQAVYDATRGLVEELARELALCLRYHSVTFRGQRPARVRLTGGEASDPQIQQILAGALPIPVEVGRNIQNVDFSAMRPTLRQGAMSDWAVAMGLSLKGTQRHFAGTAGRSRTEVAPPSDGASGGGEAEAVPTRAGPNADRPQSVAARALIDSLLFGNAGVAHA